MRSEAYAAVGAVRDEFRARAAAWTAANAYLLEAQEKVREQRGYGDYRVETPIVYNRALDDLGPGSEIKVVLVADNPGKKEQLAANNRYLVGQSGKLAEGWFGRELGIDFRREVAILNKTPVHTPKTAELALLVKAAGRRGAELRALLEESQIAMAGLAWRLFAALRAQRGAEPFPVLWISGLGELRKGGLFEAYRDALAAFVSAAPEELRGGVWAFNHFSMNQFAIEVRKKASPGAPLLGELERIGRGNARRVLGL